MKKAGSILLVLFAVYATYLYFAPTPNHDGTEMGYMEGFDPNVPYNDRYGVLGFAYARDYKPIGSNFSVENLESRIIKFRPGRFVVSLLSVIGIWTVAIMTIFKKTTEGQRQFSIRTMLLATLLVAILATGAATMQDPVLLQ